MKEAVGRYSETYLSKGTLINALDDGTRFIRWVIFKGEENHKRYSALLSIYNFDEKTRYIVKRNIYQGNII